MKRNPPDLAKIDRLPPHSIEAEQGVLGCCLLDPGESLDEALLALPDPQAFYDLRHQAIFGSLMAMRRQNVPVDVLTVLERLKEANNLEAVGGVKYLSVLPEATPSAANLSYYLETVKSKWLLRRFLSLCTEIVGRIYDGATTSEIIDQMSHDAFNLCEGGQVIQERSMRELVVSVHTEVLDKFQRGVKRHIGPQTGFNYLDNILPGFAPGQLIVEAARPGSGKSAKLMQTAENIAMWGTPVGVISLEMTALSLTTRAIFQKAGADLTKFLNGFMENDDVQKLTGAGDFLRPLPIWIDETPSLSIEDVEIRARRWKRRHNIGILFIDYFQLLHVRQRQQRQWNTNDEMGHISKRLKALARELQIPVYIAAQMNRDIEKETHRRPRLSDLRDTGQLEQDADVVMFLWRPDLSSDAAKARVKQILPRMPVPEDWRRCTDKNGEYTAKDWQKNLSIVMCTVAKQREGRSNEDATMVFIKPWTRFVDAYTPARQEALPQAQKTAGEQVSGCESEEATA